MSIKIYVEGGSAENADVNEECRKAFKRFFERAGLKGHLPTVVVGRSCSNAYDRFKTALSCGNGNDKIVLLVDAEEPLCAKTKWGHLSKRSHNKLEKPVKAGEEHVYLMVQCMESWFLADREALKKFYGKGYKAALLPGKGSEEISKDTVYEILEKMAKGSGTKSFYGKGRDSFALLGSLDAGKVLAGCSHAKELVEHLNSNT